MSGRGRARARNSLLVENVDGGFRCFCSGCGFEHVLEIDSVAGMPIPDLLAESEAVQARHQSAHEDALRRDARVRT